MIKYLIKIMNFHTIIQCRFQSTRLPGKILLPLDKGLTSLDILIKNLNFDSGLNGKLLANIKNVNYETKNVKEYKKDPTSEVFGALGYLTEIDLFKRTNNNFDHFLRPKMLLRYAPGHMRKEDSNMRLTYLNAFDLDRLSSYNNFESGLSTTLGFDYKIKSKNKEINFSAAQVVSEKENLNMPSSSSIDQRFSDVVGENNFKINDNFEINYNYALDQNYKNLNYNEIETKFTFNPIKFDLNYLQEKEHIGNQEYFKASFEYNKNDNSLFSVETKRNLITNSAEYYNLSYEYLNDCLKAGLVYRREFYNDSELEPENSLMFKITLIPFGDINSPSFSN